MNSSSPLFCALLLFTLVTLVTLAMLATFRACPIRQLAAIATGTNCLEFRNRFVHKIVMSQRIDRLLSDVIFTISLLSLFDALSEGVVGFNDTCLFRLLDLEAFRWLYEFLSSQRRCPLECFMCSIVKLFFPVNFSKLSHCPNCHRVRISVNFVQFAGSHRAKFPFVSVKK